ncbi:MAG: beta-galactosidase trimerization domain-containing protein [Candidatus Latescibacteria bacterium]|nr:beta-galactosidase trimerization domain-containing protein [Candidatus Latescibacterota bacterium]
MHTKNNYIDNEIRFRQVHLDFHTSEYCPAVGDDFNPDEFADTLALAHVNSVTCFARCHHGWSYHETSVGKKHPNLKHDLLAEMIQACHTRNINVPVYITVGWDEFSAREHPEWREIRKDGTPNGASPLEAGWHKLCLNTPYLDYLARYTEELVRTYDLDGLFMDIVWQEHCYCTRCVEEIKKQGLNPENPKDMEALSWQVLKKYFRRIKETVDSIKPGLRIFHNKGNVDKGRRDLLEYFSHWELESLPTGGWGYDHFPGTARYSHVVGMDFLGMTGKFHTSWGEFGGYKNPKALTYECDLIIAMGGKCSIGDQLHPTGKIDPDTYRLIGEAYADIEAKEQWCFGVKPVSEVALFSAESEFPKAFNYSNPKAEIDAGAVRMLLERHVMFDVIDRHSDFSPYKVIILPDEIILDEKLRDKIKQFIELGGSVLSSGKSSLNPESNAFVIDIGADYEGESEWEQDYLVADKLGDENIPQSPMIMYSRAVNIKPVDCTILSTIRPPYFNRTWEHFCSHRNTPYTTEDSPYPAVVQKGNVIHFAHPVFSAYRSQGQQYLRDVVMNALDRLYPVKRVTVDMPSGGRMTFMHQGSKNRYILHLLYTVPSHRGENIDVIEDVVPIYNIPCKIRLEKQPETVYLAPSMEDLDYNWSDGTLYFVVPELYRHAMVVIE